MKGSCLKQTNATFTPPNIITFLLVYKLDARSRDLNSEWTLKDCLLGVVNLAKKTDPNKHVYSGYGIRFDSRSEFSLPDSSKNKNVISFGVDISLSLHIDNKQKDI